VGRIVPGTRQLAWFVGEMFPPDPGGHLATYLNALGETLAIALLGTLLGAVLALPLGVLAARNVIPSALLRLPIKRFFDAVRGVDTQIWSLIWINVVGLGPFAGVLAIATSDFGALGKLLRRSLNRPTRSNRKGCARRAGAAWPRCDSGSCRRCCR
jgi:phosphonate transport system permease protein